MSKVFAKCLVYIVFLTVTVSVRSSSWSKTRPPVTTGTVKGKLIWASGPSPEVERVDVSKSQDPACNSKVIFKKRLVVDPESLGVADGIAFLINPVGDFDEARRKLLTDFPEVVIGQSNCEIVPHVAIVHEGQKLRLETKELSGHPLVASTFAPGASLNADPEARSAELARQILKERRSFPLSLKCSVHYWMDGYVLNIPHPFAVVTRADGTFQIEGVPAGEQHLIVWHATKGYVNEGKKSGMSVMIQAGGTTDVGEIKLFK